MTLVPLTIATACYLWATLGLALKGQPAMALAYFAYAVANVGLIMVALGVSR